MGRKPKFLSVKEAAEQLGLSKAHLYALLQGGAPAERNGGPLQIHVATFAKWLAGRKDGRRDKPPSEQALMRQQQESENRGWNMRFRRAKALREERLNNAEEGEWLKRSEVENLLVARAEGFRRGHEDLENSLPDELEGLTRREIRLALRRAFRQLLNAYTRAHDFVGSSR